MNETKKCVSCKQTKSVDDYGMSDRRTDWLKRQCKSCVREKNQDEPSYLKPCADAPCNDCEYEKACGILGLCCKPYRISLHYWARTTKHDWIKFDRTPDQYLDGSIPPSSVI